MNRRGSGGEVAIVGRLCGRCKYLCQVREDDSNEGERVVWDKDWQWVHLDG